MDWVWRTEEHSERWRKKTLRRRREKRWESIFRSLRLTIALRHIWEREAVLSNVVWEHGNSASMDVWKCIKKKRHEVKLIIPWKIKGNKWITHTFSLNNLLLKYSVCPRSQISRTLSVMNSKQWVDIEKCRLNRIYSTPSPVGQFLHSSVVVWGLSIFLLIISCKSPYCFYN